MSVTVASFNIRYTIREDDVVAAVKRLIRNNPTLSVICLEEVGYRKHDGLRKIAGWTLIAPTIIDTTTKATPDPILVRDRDWEILKKGATQLNPVTLLPNAPFGNERARFLVWTKLKSKKGEGRWVFANCHLLAGADYNDATRAVMRQQVGNIVAWLTRRPKARVVLCGDFNQVRRSTFLKPLVDAGLTSVHQVRPLMQPPTHRADIDHVWFRRTRSKVVSAKVLRRYPSDHKPLVVTLERCS